MNSMFCYCCRQSKVCRLEQLVEEKALRSTMVAPNKWLAASSERNDMIARNERLLDELRLESFWGRHLLFGTSDVK